jgi:hypothetical protein
VNPKQNILYNGNPDPSPTAIVCPILKFAGFILTVM